MGYGDEHAAMGKVIRFRDCPGQCWSRVDWESGEPAFISVAQDGILVRRSRIGLFGLVLLRETDVNDVVSLAAALDSHVLSDESMTRLSLGMENEVLCAFTRLAVETKSAAEFCARIAKAKGIAQMMFAETAVAEATDAEKIMQDYGAALEAFTPNGAKVADVRELPHPKERIKEALVVAMRANRDPQFAQQLVVAYLELSSWQEGVGDQHVELLPEGPTPDPEQFLVRHEAIKKWFDLAEAERTSLQAELTRLGLWR